MTANFIMLRQFSNLPTCQDGTPLGITSRDVERALNPVLLEQGGEADVRRMPVVPRGRNGQSAGKVALLHRIGSRPTIWPDCRCGRHRSIAAEYRNIALPMRYLRASRFGSCASL